MATTISFLKRFLLGILALYIFWAVLIVLRDRSDNSTLPDNDIYINPQQKENINYISNTNNTAHVKFAAKYNLTSTWTINWHLVLSSIEYTNISNPNYVLSSLVQWHNPSYIGECGPQVYPMLTNSTKYEYFWPHDTMSQENGTIAWIFAIDPSTLYERKVLSPTWMTLYHYYMLCAFNDGTTVLSHKIEFMRKKNLNFLTVVCPIPLHLREKVLNTNATTNIGVSLFDIRLKYRKNNVISDNDKQPISWNNVTVPICSSYKINNNDQTIYYNDGYNRFPLINQQISNDESDTNKLTYDQIRNQVQTIETHMINPYYPKQYFFNSLLAGKFKR